MKDLSTIRMDGLVDNPNDIGNVLFIERTCDTQGYAVGKLDTSPHFSLLTKDTTTLVAGLKKFSDINIPVVYVPSSVSYSNEDGTVKVVNGDKDKIPLLSKIHSSTMNLFQSGLYKKFTLSDFDRGDVLKYCNDVEQRKGARNRHIPTISLGYGTQDCHRYSSSRITIAGNNKPYLSKGNLSLPQSSVLYDLVTFIFKNDLCKNSFIVNDIGEKESILRKKLHEQFAVALAGHNPVDLDYFRIEGMTIIIGQRIAPHCDTQNSKNKYLNHSVTVTTHLPMSVFDSVPQVLEYNIPDKYINLQRSLKSRGFNDLDSFPITSVFYSKAPLDNHVGNLMKLEALSNENDFYKVMIWALTERIGAVVDYRGHVLQEQDFTSFFKNKCAEQSLKKRSKSFDLINAPYFTLPAGYDKMGFWSIVLDFWQTIIVNIIDNVTVYHLIEFSLYCGVVCNGTSVPWRLMEEIMIDPVKSKKMLRDEFDNDLFQFLKHIDVKVAEFQSEEMSKVSRRTSILRKRGSCDENRYQYNHSTGIFQRDTWCCT